MIPDRSNRIAGDRSDFAAEIGAKAARKLEARRRAGGDVWFGLGMIGLVGWSVVIPTLVGAMLGHWIDARHADTHSWTLALLVAGLALGCINAWRWVASQQSAMVADDGDDHG